MIRWNNTPVHYANVVFCFSTKTANTAMKRAIQTALGHSTERVHAEMERWTPQQVAESDYDAIAISRNPYARAVSCWWQKLGKQNPGISALETEGYNKEMTFIDFLRRAVTQDDESCEIHLISQHYGMTWAGKFLPHAVYKLEDSQMWAKIQRRVSIDLPELLIANASNPPDWKELCEGDAGLLVRRRWGRDFDVFGYDL